MLQAIHSGLMFASQSRLDGFAQATVETQGKLQQRNSTVTNATPAPRQPDQTGIAALARSSGWAGLLSSPRARSSRS
jgi:hypothetical protein